MNRILLILLVAVVFIACNEDPDPTNFSPHTAGLNVLNEVPRVLGSNAIEVKQHLLDFQLKMSTATYYMASMATKSTATEFNTTYQMGIYSVDYLVSAEGYYFNYDYTITDTSDIPNYRIDGWEKTDGTIGAWNYLPDTIIGMIHPGAVDTIRLNWSQYYPNDHYYDLKFWLDSIPAYYTLRLNEDSSGTIQYFVNDEIYYEAEWDENAHGNQTFHDVYPSVDDDF